MNDSNPDRQALLDERNELHAAIRGVVDAWEGGDLAGAVNRAAGLLPDAEAEAAYPTETFTVFQVDITQDHVESTSTGAAAVAYFAKHPDVEHIRVLARDVGEDGDWFDTARHLSDSETFERDWMEPCIACGGTLMDGECTTPTCTGEHRD